jgi:hypothetical protein
VAIRQQCYAGGCQDILAGLCSGVHARYKSQPHTPATTDCPPPLPGMTRTDNNRAHAPMPMSTSAVSRVDWTTGGGGQARETRDDTTHPHYEARETVGRGNNDGGKGEGGDCTCPTPTNICSLDGSHLHLGHDDRGQGQGKGGEQGRKPSTQHPLLRAFACRVDWVLMAVSPPVDGHVYTCCKGKTLLELETTHSENGKGQGIAKEC